MENLLKLLEESFNSNKCLLCQNDLCNKNYTWSLKKRRCINCSRITFTTFNMPRYPSFNDVVQIDITDTKDYNWNFWICLNKSNNMWEMEIDSYDKSIDLRLSNLDVMSVTELELFFKSIELFK